MEKDIREYNPVVLAFIGDAVHTLYVRESLARTTDYKANKLHKITSGEVKAAAQAEKADRIQSLLTEAEKDIYLRARNAHTGSSAKNASIGEYKKATGFEAVIGYLYLTGQNERLKELLK